MFQSKWRIFLDIDYISPWTLTQKALPLNSLYVNKMCEIKYITTRENIDYLPVYCIKKIEKRDTLSSPYSRIAHYEKYIDKDTIHQGAPLIHNRITQIQQFKNIIKEEKASLISAKITIAKDSSFVSHDPFIKKYSKKLEELFSPENVQILTFNEALTGIGRILRDQKIYSTFDPSVIITGALTYYRWISMGLVPYWNAGVNQSSEPMGNISLEIIGRLSTLVMLYDWIFIEETKRKIYKNGREIDVVDYSGYFDLITFYFDTFMIWACATFDLLAWLIVCNLSMKIERKRLSFRLDSEYKEFSNQLRNLKEENEIANNIYNLLFKYGTFIQVIYTHRNLIAHQDRPTQSSIGGYDDEGKPFSYEGLVTIRDSSLTKKLGGLCYPREYALNKWGFLSGGNNTILLKITEFIQPAFKTIVTIANEIFQILFPSLNIQDSIKEQDKTIHGLFSKGFFFPPFNRPKINIQ